MPAQLSADSSPPSALAHSGHPRRGEIKGAGERQLISQHLFHSNSLIFGHVTPKLQTAQVADGAKTLSWARSQLERYHRTPAHQGDRPISVTALEQSCASPTLSQTVTRCSRGREKIPPHPYLQGGKPCPVRPGWCNLLAKHPGLRCEKNCWKRVKTEQRLSQ